MVRYRNLVWRGGKDGNFTYIHSRMAWSSIRRIKTGEEAKVVAAV